MRRDNFGNTLLAVVLAAAVGAGMICALPQDVHAIGSAISLSDTASDLENATNDILSSQTLGDSDDSDNSDTEEQDDNSETMISTDEASDAEEKPAEYTEIHISSEEDLRNLATECHLDSWSRDKKVLLDTDLVLTQEGPSLASFGGIFDGQGHTISGFYLEGDYAETGLFGTIQSTGTVQNLTVKGTITPSGKQTRLGGIAGINRGEISYCSFEGTITADTEAGGIAGRNMTDGVIRNCSVSGDITADTSTGGIVGYNEGTISGCISEASVNTTYTDESVSTDDVSNTLDNILMTGQINSTSNVSARIDTGGIAGYNKGVISSCTNNGPVGYQYVGYNVGGIAGRNAGYMENCVNKGNVTGRKDVGGIVGQLEPLLNLNFDEATIDKVNDQLDQLNSLIKSTIDSANGYNSATLESLNRLSELAQEAKNNMNAATDRAQEDYNDAADKINDAEDKVNGQLDNISGSIQDVQDYLDDIEDALENLQDENSDIKNIATDGWADLMEFLPEMAEDASSVRSILVAFMNGYQSVIGDDQNPDALTIIRALGAGLQAAKEAAQGIDVDQLALDLLQYGRDLKTWLENYGSQLKEQYPDIYDALEKLADRAENTTDILQTLQDAVDTVSGLDLKMDRVSEEISASGNNLYDIMDEMNRELNNLSGSLSGDVSETLSNFQQISDLFKNIADTLTDDISSVENDLDTDAEDKIEDDSKNNADNITSGRVTTSRNSGYILASSNCGGIAGTIGIEYDLDPEEDIQRSGRLNSNFIMNALSEIDSCTNNGRIKTRGNNLGGIAGNMDMGYCTDNESYGTLSTEDGDYVGGIAGYSVGDVDNNFAKCDLSGDTYIGGITGYGEKLSGNISMVTVSDRTQYYGAIAGKVKEVTADEVSANYFYTESALYGIDQISYEGIAEPKSYDEILALSGIPESFRKLLITFIVDDEVLTQVECDYGSSLSDDQIPEIPEKDGFYGEWSISNFDYITSDLTVEAHYSRIVTLLCSELKRNTLSEVCIEGSFRQDDTLQVSRQDPQEGETERIAITIPDDGSSTHTVRYLPSGDPEDTIIYKIDENGERTKLETGTFGRYMTFEADENTITIAEEQKSHGTEKILAAVATAAGAAVLIAVLAKLISRFFKRRKIRRNAVERRDKAGKTKKQQKKNSVEK